MKIRDAAEDELPFLRQQRVKAYEEHTRKIPEGHWQALKQAISSKADLQPGVQHILAEIDGDIVGSIILFPAKTDAYEGLADKLDYPEIRMLAVDPQFRGKGAATALVYECIQRSRKQGYKSIGLHTGEFMDGAIRLYEGLGFERLPQYDFIPADDGIVVKAYCLSLQKNN